MNGKKYNQRNKTYSAYMGASRPSFPGPDRSVENIQKAINDLEAYMRELRNIRGVNDQRECSLPHDYRVEQSSNVLQNSTPNIKEVRVYVCKKCHQLACMASVLSEGNVPNGGDTRDEVADNQATRILEKYQEEPNL